MSGTVRELTPVVADPDELAGDANDDHPMRTVTRQVAFDPGGWTPDRAAKVAELFDGLAPEWNLRMSQDRVAALLDALDRGRLDGAGRRERPPLVVELGAGTGFGTERLRARFERVVAVDLSWEMLSRLVAPVPRVRADASTLPLADGTADVLVLVNMLLFPREAARVLSPGGALVWVNSLAERTPIHLSASDVVAALPGTWEALASRAAGGSWCVARRRQA
jgi:SAM-dependent methyltransferase